MYKLLLILLVLGSQFTFTACTIQRVPLTPLTDAERQTLGTIGIAAEVSRLETQYSRDPSIVDDGLRAMQDRLNDAGQGAIDGAKRVYLDPLGNISCGGGQSPGIACVGTVLVAVLFKGVVMTGGAIAGGLVGAIDGKTYSNPPLMELPERAVIQAVQDSIDAVGLPDRLRDHVWERAQTYQGYHFERLSELPADPANLHSEYNYSRKVARYGALRDKGIQTLLKMRIPLIEFRGSDLEDSFQLLVHIETTLLRTDDHACIRHRTWEYQGGSHHIAEWNKDGSKLLVEEIDRGLHLIARRVTPTFFEKTPDISLEAISTVILKSESLSCVG